MIPNTRSLSEQIYDWLKERIMVGVLAPDQRLAVDSVAAEIGVSRTPVRDAINRLAVEGLVVVSPRRGTVVAKLSMHDIEELYETRAYLEPSIAGRVAENASATFIADLEQLQAEWESIDPTKVYRELAVTTRYTDINAAFHMRIIEETGNSRLVQMLGQLYVQPRIAPLVFGTDYRGPTRRMAEHRQIIDALRRHDVDAAEQAMHGHLTHARDDLTQFLRDAEHAKVAAAR